MVLRVGFIGLGLMGSSMAEHVLKGNYPLTVFNRTAAKTQPLKQLGAHVAETPAAVGSNVDVLLLCAGDGNSVKDLLFGKSGAATTLARGSVVVDHTTISPTEAEQIGEKLSSMGIDFLDAPVTGGDKGARLGKLTTMVGGNAGVFARVKPILACYSAKIMRIGEVGFGQRMKCVNQICAILNSVAVSEALSFGAKLGLDLQQCFDIVSSGAGTSWVLENFGPKIISGDDTPGFSVRHSRKDMGIVLAEAERLGVQLRLSPGAKHSLDEAFQEGFAEQGNHTVFKIFQEKR